VLWLGNAVVSPCQAESEHLADFADVEATVRTYRVSSCLNVDRDDDIFRRDPERMHSQMTKIDLPDDRAQDTSGVGR
jgi:hypothetical protein